MRGWTISAGSCEAGTEDHIAIFSDPHIKIQGDNRLLLGCLDEAVALGCRLVFNGDISDWIYYLDKRYTPSRAQQRKGSPEDDPELDAEIDNAVEYLEEFLAPYAEHIDFIAYGNHETAAIKRYMTNPVRRVCKALKVKSGAYRQLVRYRWEKPGGQRGGSLSLDIYMHHGGRGASSASKGILSLREMYLGATADVYVMGHGHKAVIDGGDVHWYMDRRGNIRKHVRKGMQVPGFQEDSSQSGREYEDKFYRGTPKGYGIIDVTFTGYGMEYDLRVKVREGHGDES